MTPGTLWGVGLGPGDPELVTVKAARVIAGADVVAYHSARHGRSIARGIAEGPALGHVITLAEDAWLAADFPLDQAALAVIADQAVSRVRRDNN